MITTLNVTCVRGPYLSATCLRTIEMESEATLYDLHEAIQDAVDFGRDHPYEFFLAHSWRGERQRLCDAEDWDDVEAYCFRTPLSRIFPTGRKRLHYLFDYGDQWIFEIRPLRGMRAPEPSVSYPRVVRAEGPDPSQYPQFED